MGLDSNACRLLLYAKRRGAEFTRTLSIGRLSLRLNRRMMSRAFKEFELYKDENQISKVFSNPEGFSEPFFHELGARRVDSVDATDYEGASLVHDLNCGMPQNSELMYDAVVDGGTLEHVFNFPIALKTTMNAVKIGGRFFTITQCNNAMGHGFYQFSPELYFRVFSPENGFILENMFIAEGSFGMVPWYSVADPLQINHRVELVNDVQTYLLVIARRVDMAPIFKSWPQQSDYAAAWREQKPDTSFRPISEAEFNWRDELPPVLKRFARGLLNIFRRRFFYPFYNQANLSLLAKIPFKPIGN